MVDIPLKLKQLPAHKRLLKVSHRFAKKLYSRICFSKPTDTSNVVAYLESLPGRIEYEGEFGSELVLFLPWVTWLSRAGLLKNRTIVTYRGMRCFYDGLDCQAITERNEPRRFVAVYERNRFMPVRNEHLFDQNQGASPFHSFPDMRKKFGGFELPAPLRGKPLLIIHNKYNVEWRLAPINFIAIDVLDQLFASLGHRFHIVYIRHGMRELNKDFSDDESVYPPFADAQLLARYQHIHVFDDLYDQYRSGAGQLSLNAFKCGLYAHCYRFITSQGGGAYQVCMFSGSLVAILHKRGEEEKGSYEKGHFRFLAEVPPIIRVCRSDKALLDQVGAFSTSTLVDGRVMLQGTSEGSPL